MEFEDKTLTCEDCGDEFPHTAEDQARYAERGFASEPKRCRPCRQKRKERSAGGGGGRGGGGRGGGGRGGDGGFRESFEVVCASCGVTTTVPFKPTGARPVYCRDCYRTQKD